MRFAVLVVAAALPWVASCGGRDAPSPAAAPAWVERVAPAREPAAGPVPLLVLLHGIGGSEDDLFPLARRLDPRLTVVSLRAPREWRGGWAWFAIDFQPTRVRPDRAQARATLADLAGWIAAAPARLGTDPRRTFLLGFSQGAMMSLGMLVTAPEGLAGVVALSGRGPDDLFEIRAGRAAIARVPLLVVHGTADDVLPIADGRQTRDTFAPLSPDLTYRELPMGHTITDEELALIANWLTARLEGRT